MCLFLFLQGRQHCWIKVPPLGPYLTFISSLQALSPNTVTLRLKASTYEFFLKSCTFVVSLKLGSMSFPTWLLIFRIVLTFLGPSFLYEF